MGSPAQLRAAPIPTAQDLDGDWQAAAACLGADSDLFFHPTGERDPSRTRRQRAAKAVCARCPVRAACLAYALDRREIYGVWGGTTEEERAALFAAADYRVDHLARLRVPRTHRVVRTGS